MFEFRYGNASKEVTYNLGDPPPTKEEKEEAEKKKKWEEERRELDKAPRYARIPGPGVAWLPVRASMNPT